MATSDKLICSLCEDEGFQNSAVQWCTDCCSFLCNQCWRHHQRNRSSKHHHTIAAENYQELPDFIKNTNNQCQKHDKRIEMYCRTHECTCCIECLADNHKTCPDLRNIEYVLSSVKSSAATSKVQDKLIILQQNYDEIMKHLKKERRSVNQQSDDKLQELRDIRQKINFHFDKLEQQFTGEIESRALSLIVELDATTSRVESKQNAIKNLIKDHEIMLNYATDLQTFIGLSVINESIKTETEFLKTIQESQELKINKLKVLFSPTLDLLLGLDSLGKILYLHNKAVIDIKPVERDHSIVPMQISISDFRPTLLKTFTVSEERKVTFITECDLLPNGDFMIADQNEPFVKYYNKQGVMTNKINSENKAPFDVCCIDDNKCAISINNRTLNPILIVDTKTNKVINKVDEGAGLKHLCFDKEILASCYEMGSNKREVKRIDTDGRVINRFTTNKSRGIFSSENRIYYNVYRPSAIVCADISGNIKWKYQDPSIKDPRGIVVDGGGFVFVANHDSDSVVVIYPDGKNSDVVLSKDNGMKQPLALAIDRSERKLMVCNKCDGRVFLYQF